MGHSIIQVDNLKKRYKKSSFYSLNGVSFSVEMGDKFGIFGPNGAGKTTLISILCGVLKQTSGSFSLTMPNQHNYKTPVIGFVPQDFALYDNLSALRNLEYFGALCNVSPKRIAQRSHRLLILLGLSNVARKKVKTFSGGMKRRLNLAIGLIHNPDILFLDEPTVGVDIHSKNAIISFLNSINKQGTTIIYTSHHLSEAEEFCNTISIIDHGNMIANGKLENILSEHNSSNLTEVLIKLTGKELRDNV